VVLVVVDKVKKKKKNFIVDKVKKKKKNFKD
jgi:hypothetical protein